MPTVTTAPGRLPVLGHALPLIRRPVDFLSSLREYGDVVRIFLGTTETYVVTSAPAVYTMLTTDAASFTRGLAFDKARKFFGSSVAILSGPEHRKRRLMLQPAFTRARAVDHLAGMQRAVTEATAGWRSGQVIAMEKEMHRLSASLLIRSLTGDRLSDDELAEILRCAPVLMRGTIVRTVMPTGFDALPLPTNRRFAAATRSLQAVVMRMLAEDRAGFRTGGVERGDLVSLLVSARDADGAPLTDQQIYDELITLLIGGLGNVAAALAWTFHELGRHPEIEARVQAEVDAVLGDGPLDAERLRSLELTDRCIDEAIRPRGLWLLIRRTLVPVEVAEVPLPAGTEVMYSLSGFHRDPRVFVDPMRFDPDRMLDERLRELPRHAYFPFGAGPHKCIGEHLGSAAVTLAVAAIVRRWQLRAADGRPVRETVDATVWPKRLPMVVTARAGATTREVSTSG